MGDRSDIEWTDATWNPVSGCTKVSQGCKHCYAKRLWPRVYGADRPFEDVQVHPNRLDLPRRWQRPRLVFVNSMSDLFHEAVPFEFVDQVFDVMAETPRHTYQVLTKRPERALGYIRWSKWNTAPSGLPRNIWFGVSAEDQQTADQRVPLLLSFPAQVRFLSFEPMLGPADLSPYLWGPDRPCADCPEDADCECGFKTRRKLGLPSIDWVICGGESGPHARPMHPDWARSLRDQAVAAGVPFFFKQWGEWSAVSQVPLDRDIRNTLAPKVHVGDCQVARYGKRVTGSLLDGRAWREFPVGG